MFVLQCQSRVFHQKSGSILHKDAVDAPLNTPQWPGNYGTRIQGERQYLKTKPVKDVDGGHLNTFQLFLLSHSLCLGVSCLLFVLTHPSSCPTFSVSHHSSTASSFSLVKSSPRSKPCCSHVVQQQRLSRHLENIDWLKAPLVASPAATLSSVAARGEFLLAPSSQ